MSAIDAASVLEHISLRDAVYRQRTPTHGLRSAISLGCIPLRCFPAVAAWAAPWDVVTPLEACVKVTALDITTRQPSQTASVNDLVRLAKTVHTLAHAPLPDGCPFSDAPFSNVRSLNLRYNSWEVIAERERADYAVRLILQSLPALESFMLDGMRPFPTGLWFSLEKPDFATISVPGHPPCVLSEDETAAACRALPKLKSVDLHHMERAKNKTANSAAYFESLLLCRGTLKTITTVSANTILSLVGDKRTEETLRLCVPSEAPVYQDPPATDLAPWTAPRVPVHWTLEKLVVHEEYGYRPTLPDMLWLVMVCPRLQVLKLRTTYFKYGPDKHITTAWSQRRIPHQQSTLVDAMKKSCDRRLDVPKEEHDAMGAAHGYVRSLVAAFEADIGAMPPSFTQHRKGLQQVLQSGTYPAALLWALCRGPEHTVLHTVDMGLGPLSEKDAEAVSAVVALGARMRRKARRQTSV